MKRSGFNILICFVLFCSLATVQTFADEVDNLYARAAEKYHELFKDTSFRKQADNWLKTIKQFQLIYQQYPNHPQAPKALFSIGKLYRSLYRWNEEDIYLDRSNISFRALVREYPESALSDDAQYLLAENYELFKKDADLAQVEYKRVVDLYPDGTAVQKARSKLAQYQTGQPVAIDPGLETAASPDDLYKSRFGGLNENESLRSESMMVSKVDYWSTIDWSRMVINVKGEVRYKYHLLKEDAAHPQKRLYIDLYNAYLPQPFENKIAANDGLISQARIAQFDSNTVRIVLDIDSLEKIKVFHFQLPHQYKIVIDIIGSVSVSPVRKSKPDTLVATDSAESELERERELSLSKALGLKVKTIIIDPGHGGKDPGAMAFNMQEKDIVLEIANNLKELVNEYQPHIKTLLTRSTDEFIELEARTAYANQNKGDLFISLHVNASLKPKLSGVETYFLNLTTDDDALTLAAKENQSSLKSISDLQTILNDLMVNSKIKESRDLAEIVQASMVKTIGSSIHQMPDLGVKQAPFTVLIGAQMPSILIESGFITNKNDNGFLRNEDYKKVIAQGIYDGIKHYME